MKKYIVQTTAYGNLSISYEEDNKKIIFDETPGNRHYEEYLAWIAEGNEPEVINDQS